jgi:saccharopine dehydrogenase-like NADP-dependent oxidoreductase
MRKVLILGAGKIGTAIAHLLHHAEDYALTVADYSPAARAHVADAVPFIELDAGDTAALGRTLGGFDVVVNACPYHLNETIAVAASQTRTHYFDLTEDVAAMRAVQRIAHGADVAFVPQCGLAPGFIGIAGMAIANTFDRLDSLRLRVGALPLYGVNALKYSLTWSTDGLINEYCNPCEVIIDGRRSEVPALDGLEEFILDGIAYEAFNTSGGLGTLADSLEGRVRNLDYKSIRYPGHGERIRLLAVDLGLGHRRDLFKQVLEAAIPTTTQDVVVVLITAVGDRGGRLVQDAFARRIHGRAVGGTQWSAIQLATATGACAMIDLHGAGRLPARGFVRQEDARLDDFLSNRFGRLFA